MNTGLGASLLTSHDLLPVDLIWTLAGPPFHPVAAMPFWSGHGKFPHSSGSCFSKMNNSESVPIHQRDRLCARLAD